ncbi:hypothetical protein ACFO9Q_16500 [Paenibacillus sp. GCM10023252]|uniref:hypothetical protein n=1 Tax=Paenibacillus sp. GCM10023252 TaxID=3252649 RepID=UPI003606E749
MQKLCNCGNMMTMKLRTVIYSVRVEIDNVPIYSCEACSRSEVFPEVKPDLTGLIAQLGEKPSRQTLLFNEWNEWADLFVEASALQKKPDPRRMDRLIEERINSLLDLLLLAQAADDQEWIADIYKRLNQISRRRMHT